MPQLERTLQCKIPVMQQRSHMLQLRPDAAKYVLKEIALAIWGLWCFCTDFKILFCLRFATNDIGNLIETALNL